MKKAVFNLYYFSMYVSSIGSSFEIVQFFSSPSLKCFHPLFLSFTHRLAIDLINLKSLLLGVESKKVSLYLFFFSPCCQLFAISIFKSIVKYVNFCFTPNAGTGI